LIAACIVSIALLLERRFVPASNPSAMAQGSKLIGKPLDVPGVDWKAHPVRTVLYMSTHCHFCLDSMAYYRRLAEARSKSGALVPLTVVSLDAPEDIKGLLSAEHVAADGVYKLPSADPRLRSTPMLLIADSKGIVRRAYIGKLGPIQEAEFLGILRSGAL